MKQTTNTPICKSIFQNGAAATSRAQFTQKWIEMVRRMENGKSRSGAMRA